MKHMLALLSLSVTILFTTPVSAGDQVEGDLAIANAWCVRLADAELLSQHVAMSGDEGYKAVMVDQNTSCYDVRMEGVNPVPVELLEKLWSVEHTDGRTMEFWRTRDTNHIEAFMWFLLEGEAV